ncbi:MAG: hypothetical protein JNK63_08755 [Chthonomonas sp.]|nr:hypothetical protein [Chthonomonas sp.]
MSKAIKDIEAQIIKLSPAEFAELRDWFVEHDAKAWDAQIDKDAASGRLDKLFGSAIEDHSNGKSREL